MRTKNYPVFRQGNFFRKKMVFQAGQLASRNLIAKTDQFLAPNRLLELTDGLRLNLSDAFPRYLENVSDFFERIAVSVSKPLTELDDLAFPIAQGLEDLGNFQPEHLQCRAKGGIFRRTVRQQVAEVGILAVSYRPVEADGITIHR